MTDRTQPYLLYIGPLPRIEYIMISTTSRYEALVQAFIENLMKFPDTFIRVPKPLLHKNAADPYGDETKKVFSEVCNMLQIMGIEYEALPDGLMIKVIPPKEIP